MNTTLYVTNLPLTMSSSDLEDLFTLIGNVRSAKILRKEGTGESLGIGLVEMSTRTEAEDGVLHFNRKVVEGRSLLVRMNEIVATKRSAVQPVTGRPAYLKLQKQVTRLVKAGKR